MRKSPLLAVLFSGVRQGILSSCMLQPEKWWYLSELASHLHSTPSSLQRDLRSFVKAGILEARREGTRIYFKANTQAPIFPELYGLIEKTAGVIPVLDVLLEPFRERISCAFIYGSVARGAENAGSDIDLMVIGRVGLAELSTPLRNVEKRLGREVNVSAFSPQEFHDRVKANDHFLAAVLGGPKHFVKGDKHELGTIIGEQRRAKASHHEAGDRQPARSRRA